MTREQAFRWGQAPLAFELTAGDPAVIRRAAVVLGPWSPPAAPPVRTWRIEETPGDAVAGVAHWTVTDGTEPIPEQESLESALAAVERLAIHSFWACPAGPVAIHGALLAANGTGVLLVGMGGSGKSTLATALWQRGFLLLSDDVSLVDLADGHARPAPRRVSLRAPSRELLGRAFWDHVAAAPSSSQLFGSCLFHPRETDPRPIPASVRVGAIVFLDRPGGTAGPGRLVPLASAQALLALLSHADLFVRDGLGAAIRESQPLVSGVRAYDLGRGPLRDMTRAVEGAIGGAP